MSHELLHGDCYDIIPSIADKSVALVITDPLYQIEGIHGSGMFSDKNAARYGRKRGVAMLDELAGLDSVSFSPARLLDALLPKMGRFYGYFFCNKVLVPEYIGWAECNGFSFDILVMCKSNPVPAHSTHHVADLEYVILIRDKGTYFNGSGLGLDDYRKFYQTTCRRRIHPAEKPVGLLERFVRVSCPKGGTVLDPFMGSASTGIAALKNGCNFIGIEKDEHYYDVAKKRVDDFYGVGGLFDMVV